MDSRRAPRSTRVLRSAFSGDAAAVRRIDDLTFPADSLDMQRAEPGELEAGIEAGDLVVLEQDDELVGYVFVERSNPRHIYISGIAVHPGLQGLGLGGVMMDHVLHLLNEHRHTVPIVTVTSPRNYRMLRTLFKRGFAVRWALRDYFGLQRHRFGCQLLTQEGLDRPAVRLLPAADPARVFRLAEQGHELIRGLVHTGTGPHFETRPRNPLDFLPTEPP